MARPSGEKNRCDVPEEELIGYMPDTGEFFWKIRRGRAQEKFNVNSDGYYRVKLNYTEWLLHRLAFKLMGEEVPEIVDHINGDKTDNRWCNLRRASYTINANNCRMAKNNTSGVKGVNFHQGKWRVRVSWGGKRHSLGAYDDLELAELIAMEARESYQEGFCHGWR